MITMPLKLKTNNMFWTNFKLCIRQNKKILVVISILQLLGLPLMSVLLTAWALEPDESAEISLVFFLLISIFCLGVSIICGIIIAVNNFSYLHKKSQVDMIYSLPIKRKYKFISDYLAGLSVYLVPYIAACILSIGILLASGVCIDNISKLIDDKGFIGLILQCEFAGLLIMTLLYTLTVFVLNCCGTLFESIVNILIINILIPGVIAVIAAMFFADLYGVSIFDTILPVLGYTSPVGAVIYLCYALSDASFSSEATVCISAAVYIKWAVFFLLFTAAVFAVSMVLYLKRKAEDVSKPYVYRLLYYFVITAILMAISLIARYNVSTIVPVIVFSLIVYLIFEVITNRGFKKIYKSLIRYTITMVSILIICIIAVGTKGFGTESRVPSADSVKSVKVSYQGFDRSVVLDNQSYLDNKYDRIYSQKDVIERIIEVHEDVLDLYYEGEFSDYYNSDYHYYTDYYDSEVYDDTNTLMTDYPRYSLNLTYNLKTGATIERDYYLTFEQIKKLFILDSTPQMSEFMEKIMMSSIRYDSYVNDKKQVSYSVYIYNLQNNNSNEYSISTTQAKELCKAYAEDYSNMTTDQMLTDNIYCYIDSEYPVRESFENTIKWLEKNNMTVPEASAFDYYMAVMYPPEGLKCWGSDDASASFGSVYLMQSYGRMLSFEQFESMLELGMLRRPYYEEADCYSVNYNNKVYIIPSQFSQKAESLYNSLDESGAVVSKETFINELRNGENVSYLIDKWGMDYSTELYNELNLLQELSFRWYEDYTDFDEYYGFSFDETSNYFAQKLQWDYWQYFSKFYGYDTVEDYMSYHSFEDIRTIEEEWNVYEEVFPELIKQLNK